MTNEIVIHETADVRARQIGAGTTIGQFVVVLEGARLGARSSLFAHCYVGNEVVIGDRVTVKPGVCLWDGTRLEDDVFIGPNVTFTGDNFIGSKEHTPKLLPTIVEAGALVGGGAILLKGVTIGRGAVVEAGAVVTQSVPPYAIVTGSPARIVGYVETTALAGSAKDQVMAAPPPQAGIASQVGVGSVTLHRMKSVRDMRGDLSVGEFPTDIPFQPKRYFLVFNVPNAKPRGEHAHRECHQFLICVKGSCAVVVDDGGSRCEVLLDSPSLGLHLPPLTWGIQYKYSTDAVLLVFTSHYYDAGDYIRSYADFIDIKRGAGTDVAA